MKKILLAALLLVSITGFAQSGIKLTGKTFISQSDSTVLTAIYCQYQYTFRSKDSSILITLNPFFRSIYAAKNTPNSYLNLQDFGIPQEIGNYYYKSTTGAPTPTQVYDSIQKGPQFSGFVFSTFN
jgi:hypothetical protein